MADLSDRIADVRRKAVEATPGPWKQHLVDDTTVITGSGFDVCRTFPDGGTDDDKDFHSPVEQHEADGAYIAAASPDLIIQMADRIEELEKEREEAVLVREYAHRVTAAAARNKALDEAAAKVRLECAACGGTGHASEDAECEYCGRQMRAIRAAIKNEEQPQEPTDAGQA